MTKKLQKSGKCNDFLPCSVSIIGTRSNAEVKRWVSDANNDTVSVADLICQYSAEIQDKHISVSCQVVTVTVAKQDTVGAAIIPNSLLHP